MTPEQFRQVEALFHNGKDLPTEQQRALLDSKCGDDSEVRAEVENLLAQADPDKTLEVLKDKLNQALRLAADEPRDLEHASKETIDRSPVGINEVFAERYLIQKELGRGGFGIVFRAFDQSALQRAVALKVIRVPDQGTPERNALARERFLAEARLAGSLSHQNIATILDVGEFSGCVYMTQELAPGRELGRELRRAGFLSVRRVTSIMRQVCEGLAHAHANNIVHRDIKPSNIIIDEEDRVKITDFGIAQSSHSAETESSARVAGTPGYMAPEQLRGEKVDARADIFAVGCVLYQMLVGRPPFEGETFASVAEKTLHNEPPAPSRVREDLPRALDRIVARAMRKNACERYDNIERLAQDVLDYEKYDYLTPMDEGAQVIGDALERQQCILFLGLRLKGVSNERAGGGTTEDRIAAYLADVVRSDGNGRSLSRVAQDYEMERGRVELLRRLAVAVREIGVSPREIVRRVARLHFPVIVTTTYDATLEEELAKTGRKVVRALDCQNVPDDTGGADLLVHLFGRADSEETVIVTEDDLWRFFGEFHSLADVLKSHFATRPLLFVGYGAESEDFRHLFSEICRFRAGRQGGCYLPASDVSVSGVRWAERKGLQLIDADPGSLLTAIEEAIVEKRRHPKASEGPKIQRHLPGRPYKFLNHFEVADEAIFFGREAEARKVLSKIHAYPLNLLYAPSGSGKTSLIHAGLFPQLRAEEYLPVYARVYDDPIGEVRRAVCEATGATEVPARPESPLHEYLHERASAAGKPLVIFVDQFEEIFIRHDHKMRDRFAEELQACIGSAQGKVRFVLALREDFLARLSEFRKRIPTVFHNEFRLDPLDEDAARAAIIQPAKLLGIEVDPKLVDRLVSDLTSDGIEPPQLQIVCDTLYDALKPGEKRISLTSYVALGETRKILSGYLERVLRELPPPQREPTREILKNLVTSEETKSVSRMDDLVRIVGRPEEEVSSILSELSDRRLVRRVHHAEGSWYELTHEYLVEEIGRWLSDRERELKKIRELLDQAVRNYRHLGILVPRTTIRLIRAHEDDLNLGKEERLLLRASERALRTKRKVVAAVGTLAAVLLLCAGVAWRYTYLAAHVFLKSEDRELISYDWDGSRKTHRFEGIRVYAGAPTPWWLDSYLGFPKPLHRTVVELGQLAPEYRDEVKSGLLLDRKASIEDEVLGMLAPCDRVRFLIATDRTDEALHGLERLYYDRTIDDKELDQLTCFLGRSRIDSASVVSAAVEHVFRRSGRGFDPYRNSSLIGLLAFLPSPVARKHLIPFLEMRRTRGDALEILAAIAEQSDGSILTSYLDDNDDRIRSRALRALARLGDCSVLAQVREILADSQSDTYLRTAAAGYLSDCGDEGDLALLEQAARHAASGPFGATSFVRAAYELAGPAAVPTILRILALKPLDEWAVRTLQVVQEPEIRGLLRKALADPQIPVRAYAAWILAAQGDTAGLVTAAGLAADGAEDARTRASAVSALAHFQSAELNRFLLQLLETTDPAAENLRRAAYGGLHSYDDQVTLSALIQGLSEQHEGVREEARWALLFMGSKQVGEALRTALSSPDSATRVYAARALQDVDDLDHSDVFKAFLETESDTATDYSLVVDAIHGLRNSYLDLPAEVAAEALRHPHDGIRLAASLALIEHADRSKVVELLDQLSQDVSPNSRLAARRTQWALHVVEDAEAAIQRAHNALAEGDPHTARRILNQAVGRAGYQQVLGMVLAPKLKDADPFGRSSYGQAVSPRRPLVGFLPALIELRLGSAPSVAGILERIAWSDPQSRQAIRQDSRFKQLHQFYSFRLAVGLEPPKHVDDLELPEVAAESTPSTQDSGSPRS